MTKQFLYTLILSFSFSLSQSQTLTVSTSQLNFGIAYENAPDSLQLTINNNLGKTVNVTGLRFYTIYGQPAFSCSNNNFSIGDGNSQTVWIKFSPLHNIYHNSELVIENDAARGFVSVDLVGQGRYSKTYYNASENLEEEALKTSLHNITGNGYITLTYNPARDTMFMWLDNQRVNGQGATQNTLECVYTGRLAVGYIDRSDCQTNDMFNTEHTWPQGLFNSLEPMKSDLHHLFPTDDMANNTRASYPFGMVTTATWSVGGSKFDNNTNIFEPRDQHKGETARAMLYFVMRYQNYNNFLNSQEGILKTWNHNFLTSTVELKRNDDIYSVQNNRNPFVDYPQLADRITSFSTTSVAPTNFSMDETQNQINYGFVLNGANTVYHYVIVNNGNQTIQFSNFNLSNTSILSFSGGSGTNTTLAPGEALGVDIDLHPSSLGIINEMLSFQTNVPGSTTVQIPIIAQSSAVSVEENKTPDEITVYPNPAIDKLYIKGVHKSTISVSNVLGQQFYLHSNSLKDELILDVSDLPGGIYILTSEESNHTLERHWFVKY